MGKRLSEIITLAILLLVLAILAYPQEQSNNKTNSDSAKKEPSADKEKLRTGLFKIPMGPEFVLADDGKKKKTFQPRYCAVVPSNYDATKKLPLIIHLHGAGDTPENALQPWVKLCQEKGYLAIAPTVDSMVPVAVRSGVKGDDVYSFISTFIIDCLDDFKQKYQSPESRIYLTGFSFGGATSFDIIKEHYKKVTAVAVVGAYPRKDIGIPRESKIVPIYVQMGEKEDVAKAKKEIEQFKQDGFDVKFDVNPNAGHQWLKDTASKIIDWFESLGPLIELRGILEKGREAIQSNKIQEGIKYFNQVIAKEDKSIYFIMAKEELTNLNKNGIEKLEEIKKLIGKEKSLRMLELLESLKANFAGLPVVEQITREIDILKSTNK